MEDQDIIALYFARDEKAIRETVRRGWQEGNRREWNRCFPGIVRCPSNREFLFRIADLLRDRQLCG